MIIPKDAALTAVFTILREQHPGLTQVVPYAEQVARSLKASSTIVDALMQIRNRGSVAHANEVLVEEAEARLFINLCQSIFHYLYDMIDRASPTG